MIILLLFDAFESIANKYYLDDREILYRALCGAQAPVLYSLAKHSGTFSQVARTLEVMRSDYSGKIDVEQLASMARMSTSESPMQYLKKSGLPGREIL